jgi:hypothetical protein
MPQGLCTRDSKHTTQVVCNNGLWLSAVTLVGNATVALSERVNVCNFPQAACCAAREPRTFCQYNVYTVSCYCIRQQHTACFDCPGPMSQEHTLMHAGSDNHIWYKHMRCACKCLTWCGV